MIGQPTILSYPYSIVCPTLHCTALHCHSITWETLCGPNPGYHLTMVGRSGHVRYAFVAPRGWHRAALRPLWIHSQPYTHQPSRCPSPCAACHAALRPTHLTTPGNSLFTAVCCTCRLCSTRAFVDHFEDYHAPYFKPQLSEGAHTRATTDSGAMQGSSRWHWVTAALAIRPHCPNGHLPVAMRPKIAYVTGGESRRNSSGGPATLHVVRVVVVLTGRSTW